MVVDDKPIRRKSNVNGAGGADDDDWLTQDLASDAVWKQIQSNTFTRYANYHLATVNKHIALLEDLSDGIRLLALVEVLSGKKMPRYNARPTMKAHKINNVDIVLRFLTDVEKVKLVNISAGDVVDGNSKLILGLMWTLIQHYSLSNPVWEGEEDFDPTLSPQQRLMKWIQSKIPDVPVNNFTTDWNDGKAIGALVDAVAPGLCPDWKSWKPEDNVKNVTEALELAEKWLDVPQLLRPKEMCNRKVDKLAVITYLSNFPAAKLKENAPLRSSAMSATGNPARVRCYGPGLQAKGVCAKAPTSFTIETFSAGKGDVDVSVTDQDGKQVPVELKYNDDKNMTYTCTYTPASEGDHKVSVKFNSIEVPKSPFSVSVKGAPLVEGHKKCKVSGPALEGAKVKVNKPTYVDISTEGAGAGQLEVNILDSQGKPNACPCRLQKVADDKYKCEFVPSEPGKHSVSISFAGKPIPKSPFDIDVEQTIDRRKVKATGRGLQPTGLRVGDQAKFELAIDDSVKSKLSLDLKDLDIKLTGPDGKEEKVNVRRSSNNELVFECDYMPTKEGDHRLSISMGGDPLKQFEINVMPQSNSKVTAFGPGLHGGTVGKPNTFTVDTNGEKVDKLSFTIDGRSEAKIACQDLGGGKAEVSYTVSEPGEYSIHVLANGEDIPNSPFCAQIKPATDFDQEKFEQWYKTAHSSEFEHWTQVKTTTKTTKRTSTTTTTTTTSTSEEKVRKMIAGLPSTMTIKMADCTGLEAYIMSPSGQKIVCDLKPHEDGSGRLSVNFTASEAGEHLVHLVKNERQVGGSPFKIQVSSKTTGDASKVKLNDLSEGKVNETNTFLIDTRDAGTGGRLAISMVGPCKPEVSCDATGESGVFKVSYTVTEAGKYDLDISYDGNKLAGSPFEVIVPKN